MLSETLTDPESGEVLAKESERITPELAGRIAGLNRAEVFIVPFVTEEMEYLSADVEDRS
jgi:DNA-directed RNA polymerase subunit beta